MSNDAWQGSAIRFSSGSGVVDVDGLDLDDGQEDILKRGDEVRFTGKFDDNEFVAESLVLVTPKTDVIVEE